MTGNTAPQIVELKRNIHKFEHLLDFDGEWTLGRDECDAEADRYVVRKLTLNGALKVVSKNPADYHKYEWRQDAQERLQEYRESLDTLPCGHRVHIVHKDNGTYGCKYCNEEREYSRDFIKSLYD